MLERAYQLESSADLVEQGKELTSRHLDKAICREPTRYESVGAQKIVSGIPYSFPMCAL